MFERYTHRPARILVVDDEAVIRETARRALEASGYEVMEATEEPLRLRSILDTSKYHNVTLRTITNVLTIEFSAVAASASSATTTGNIGRVPRDH